MQGGRESLKSGEKVVRDTKIEGYKAELRYAELEIWNKPTSAGNKIPKVPKAMTDRLRTCQPLEMGLCAAGKMDTSSLSSPLSVDQHAEMRKGFNNGWSANQQINPLVWCVTSTFGAAVTCWNTPLRKVGVDVPRAGVCVVENAEMFGLSQLHQLRGRLGRTDRGKTGQATPPVTPSATLEVQKRTP